MTENVTDSFVKLSEIMTDINAYADATYALEICHHADLTPDVISCINKGIEISGVNLVEESTDGEFKFTSSHDKFLEISKAASTNYLENPGDFKNEDECQKVMMNTLDEITPNLALNSYVFSKVIADSFDVEEDPKEFLAALGNPTLYPVVHKNYTHLAENRKKWVDVMDFGNSNAVLYLDYLTFRDFDEVSKKWDGYYVSSMLDSINLRSTIGIKSWIYAYYSEMLKLSLTNEDSDAFMNYMTEHIKEHKGEAESCLSNLSEEEFFDAARYATRKWILSNSQRVSELVRNACHTMAYHSVDDVKDAIVTANHLYDGIDESKYDDKNKLLEDCLIMISTRNINEFEITTSFNILGKSIGHKDE